MGRRQVSIFRYPARETFVWREWAVPIALAAVVALLVVARVVFTPVSLELDIPVTAPAATVPPVRPAETLAISTPAAGSLPEAPAVAAGVRVIVRCEGTTWVEATADGGEPRRYELGPGQNLAVTARERLGLSLGDAGVIRLNVNERELGFIGDKGEPKSGLSFTASKAAAAVVAPRDAPGD
jgi:hypothetical protein